MARYLITQSLISAWNYIYECHESYEEEAYQSFLRTLRREKSEPSEAMLNGIAFENEVYKEAHHEKRTSHPYWENGIRKIADIVTNAPNQVKVSRELSVDGYDFLVYGILDALKAGTIYDVKFLNKGFGSADLAGKYLNSPQHPAYLFMVPEASEFIYLLSDGEDLYTETYNRQNSRPFEDIVHEFLRSIEDMGLLETYKENWLAA